MVDEIVTQRCGAHGHPEFQLLFDADRVPRGDAVSLASHLEEAVSRGERFAPLETLQIGWTLARFGQGRPGLLVLEEPDFTSMPIRWVPGVGTTLRHLRLQRDVAASLGVQPEFPSILSAAVVCSRVPASPPGGAMRFPADRADPTDSGWFVGCSGGTHAHDDPAELRRESLYEVARTAPSLVPYLAMPPGWTVLLDGPAPRFRFEGEPRAPLPGSFVDALLRHLEA